MIKAYICVVADPETTKEVFAALKQVEGVIECHEVMGPYDIVAKLEVENLSDVPPVLSNKIRTIPGVVSTTSMVTFPENRDGRR